MILKLNTDGSITIEPQRVPESLDKVYISYIFPKGLNHLKPVLTWGGIDYVGNEMYISKTPTNFDMRVTLYNGTEIYKAYKTKEVPSLFIGYNITKIEPDLIKHITELEAELKELKERGDII